MNILLFVSGFLLTLKNNIILNSYPYEGGGLSNYICQTLTDITNRRWTDIMITKDM